MAESKVERIVAVAWETREPPKDLMMLVVVTKAYPGEVAQIEAILNGPPEPDGKTREQVLEEANTVYFDRAYEDLTSTRTQG